MIENLKEYIEKKLQKRGLENQLQEINVNYTYYRINIVPHDKQERSINESYRSSLKKAIQSAEQDFKRINLSKKIKADYEVFLDFGSQQVVIPQRYWNNYKEK